MQKLMTRDAFRESVFTRDNNVCVFCAEPAKDAHHILDRKLFADGGYYLTNGASVCNDCHMKCETGEYTVEIVREKCGISEPILPAGFNPSKSYNKWGDILLADGRRVKGPLFEDAAVQKLFKKDLWLYVGSESEQ
jgi:hypothetical protein